MAELEESTDVSIPFEYNAPKDKRHFTDEVSFLEILQNLISILEISILLPKKRWKYFVKSSKKCL